MIPERYEALSEAEKWASGVEVDRTRPGLRAVLLRDADPVRMAAPARGLRIRVLERELAGEAARGQPPREHAQVHSTSWEASRPTIGQVTHLDLELDHGRIEPEHGVGGRVDRDVDAVVVTGRVGHPADAARRPLANALFRILHREGHGVDEAAGRQLDVAVPRRQAIAP